MKNVCNLLLKIIISFCPNFFNYMVRILDIVLHLLPKILQHKMIFFIIIVQYIKCIYILKRGKRQIYFCSKV